jgi:hypothetical protein
MIIWLVRLEQTGINGNTLVGRETLPDGRSRWREPLPLAIALAFAVVGGRCARPRPRALREKPRDVNCY